MNTDNTEQLLQQAFSLAKVGQRTEAKKILSQLVRDDPRNARAWYILSQVVEQPERQIFCLKKVLEIDPGNTKAVQRLQKLHDEAFPDFAPPSAPEQPASSEQDENKPVKESSPIRVLAILGILILGAFLCYQFYIVPARNQVYRDIQNSIMPGSAPEPPSGFSLPGFSSSHTLTYRVTGPSNAMITYMNAEGGTEQIDSARLPWKKSYTLENGKFASLVAQNSGDPGLITCIIEVDGKQWKTSTSSGPYAVVTCAGWLGMD